MSGTVFKLINITPIGFNVPFYPQEICQLCRGPLIEVCVDCGEKNNDVCNVKEFDNTPCGLAPGRNAFGIPTSGTYYHEHCYKLMDSNSDSAKK